MGAVQGSPRGDVGELLPVKGEAEKRGFSHISSLIATKVQVTGQMLQQC